MALADAAPQAPDRGYWRLWVAAFCIAAPLQVTTTSSPFLNSVAMAARDLDTTAIGAIRTCEILTNACLAIFISARIVKFEPRGLALLGAALLLIGNAASMVGADAATLLGARITAGAGGGLLAAALAAYIPQFRAPHKAAAIIAAPITVCAIGAALAAGQIAEGASQIALFGMLAGAAAIGLIGVWATAPGGKAHALHAPKLGSMLGALKHPYVLGWAVIYLGSTAANQFLATIGASHGFTTTQVGQMGAATAVVCGLTAPFVGLIRENGLRIGFLAAIAAFGVGATSVALAPTGNLFFAGYILQSASFACFSILAMGVATRLDPTGGIGTAASGWNALGNAFSPAIGGVLIAGGSFLPLGVLCGVCGVLTFALMAAGTKSLKAR